VYVSTLIDQEPVRFMTTGECSGIERGYTFPASRVCVGAGLRARVHTFIAQPDSVQSVQEIRSDRSVVLYIRGRAELRNCSFTTVHAWITLKKFCVSWRETKLRAFEEYRTRAISRDDPRKGARIPIAIVISCVFKLRRAPRCVKSWIFWYWKKKNRNCVEK